jgi:hypothetical protein
MTPWRSRPALYGSLMLVLGVVQAGCGSSTPRVSTAPSDESIVSFCARSQTELQALGREPPVTVLRLEKLATTMRDALRQARSLPSSTAGVGDLVRSLELELQRIRLASLAAEQAASTESMRAIGVTIRASENAVREARRLLGRLCAHDDEAASGSTDTSAVTSP